MKKYILGALLATTLVTAPQQSAHAQGQLVLRQDQWVYVDNHTVKTTFTGLVQHQTNKRWFYVRNGKVDWSFTGLAQHQTNKRWFYVKNGEIDWKFTGLAQHQTNKRWFYVKNGEIDWKFTGLAQHQTNKRWFYVKNGEIDWKFTGLAQHQTNKRWFYVKNGEIDWRFTSAVKHTDGKTYYVQNGQLAKGKIVSTEKRNVPTPFSKTTQYSDNVPKGMTEVIVRGQNGTNEEVYTVTYIDGVQQSEVKESSRVIQKPVSQIEAIGTGYQTYKQAYDWESSTFISQKETDKAKDTIAEVKRQQLGRDYILYLRNHFLGTLTPIYSTEEMRQIVAKYFDVNTYNAEFLKLINAHRQADGKLPLQLDTLAIKAAVIRSEEQAALGDLRSQGEPHTRPDGTSWTTVEKDIPEYKNADLFFSGENILAKSDTALSLLLDAKQTALSSFEQWKESPGHNASMLSRYHTHFGIGVGFVLSKVTETKFTPYPYPFIATTIFAKQN